MTTELKLIPGSKRDCQKCRKEQLDPQNIFDLPCCDCMLERYIDGSYTRPLTAEDMTRNFLHMSGRSHVRLVWDRDAGRTYP